MASWLPFPVGFKNTVAGDLQPAINAVATARDPQSAIVIGGDGRPAAVRTGGNRLGHVVLRGGREPNFDAAAVADAGRRLSVHGLPARLMVDCSHGNSRGNPLAQIAVAHDVARQIAAGSEHIFGVMLESHLVGGAQAHIPGVRPAYGQSLTDACMDLRQTEDALEALYDGMAARMTREGVAVYVHPGINDVE